MKTLSKITSDDLVIFLGILSISCLYASFLNPIILSHFPVALTNPHFDGFVHMIMPCTIILMLCLYFICRWMIGFIFQIVSNMYNKTQSPKVDEEISNNNTMACGESLANVSELLEEGSNSNIQSTTFSLNPLKGTKANFYRILFILCELNMFWDGVNVATKDKVFSEFGKCLNINTKHFHNDLKQAFDASNDKINFKILEDMVTKQKEILNRRVK